MPPDLVFFVTLLVKMAVAATFVVLSSVITERAGPAIGALVSTLPVSAGPAFVFLALDHDAAFIAQAAIAALAINAATGVYAVSYAALAQRHALPVSVGVSLAVWVALAAAINATPWSLAGALAVNAIAYVVCIAAGQRFRHARMPLVTRRWFDIPLRAAMVAVLVATVVTLSSRVGPIASGIIATFPIVFTSLMLILQPRIGGPATAAVLANGLWGLIGFGLAVLTLQLAVVPLGAGAALSLALAVAVIWNFGLWLVRRYRQAASRPASPP